MGIKYSDLDNICIRCFFLTSAKSLGGAPTLRVNSALTEAPFTSVMLTVIRCVPNFVYRVGLKMKLCAFSSNRT